MKILPIARHTAVALSIAMACAGAVAADVSVQIAVPGVSIGINVPRYPRLVRVPNYPVYYAEQEDVNLFFYDGLYWAFQGDNWYASSWYDGPWRPVAPQAVPLYVLRVPVRYYRSPPGYFRGWQRDAPPRWDEHWGPQWSQQAGRWQRPIRAQAPPPAPLPTYQRNYGAQHYPSPEQQQALHERSYRYEPRDPVVRQQAAPGRGNGNGKAKGQDKHRGGGDDRGKDQRK